jgi:phenylalanyl-tRNA synthetase beta chain
MHRALRRIWLDGREIGVVGELHPRWRQSWELAHAPVLFELDLDAVVARQVAAFEPVPKFQPAQRDIAVIVSDTVTHGDLMEAVYSADTSGLLRDALLFDVYKPKQASPVLGSREKSLAVRALASADPLTDEQIDLAVKAVVDGIATPGRTFEG